MLSSVTLDDSTGTPVALHTDTPTSQAVLVTAQGLVGIGPLRSSKRIRPSAHGGIDETRFEEGRGPTLVGEVMSTVDIEDCLAVFRDLTRPMLETLDNGPALLKWTEGPSSGKNLQMLVRLDSDCEPILSGGAAHLNYQASFFAEDPRAYSQSLISQTGATVTLAASAPTWIPSTTNYPRGLAVNSTNVYWASSSGAIARATIAGGSVETAWLATGLANLIAVTVNATNIYWAGQGQYIGRATIAGATVTKEWLAAAPPGALIVSIAVDATHIYWMWYIGGTHSESSIGRAEIGGEKIEQEWIPNAGSGYGGPVGVFGLAVDSGHVYWGQEGGVARATITGGTVTLNWISGGAQVVGMDVDATYVYWSNYAGHSIGRVTLSGESLNQVFLGGAGSPHGLAVDAGHVYWSNNLAKAIGRGPIAGSTPGSTSIVSQPGNRPTPLVFKIYGLIENPNILRASDGSRIALVGTVPAGNHLEVNVAARTVKLNGVTNALSFLEPSNTNWAAFEAPPSPSSSTYSLTCSSATAAFMEVLYRPAHA